MVSSPAYAAGCAHTGGHDPHPEHIEGGTKSIVLHTYGSTPGNLGNLPAGNLDAVISSPPYEGARIDGNGDEGASNLRGPNGEYLRGSEGWAVRKAMGKRYGADPGNLGNLPAGDLDAIVSSPPFSVEQPCASQSQAKKDYHAFTRGNGTKLDHSMESDGNLATIPATTAGFSGIVSSPPYQTGGHHEHQMDAWNTNGRGQSGKQMSGYADESPGQLQGHGDDFWTAAAAIVSRCYQVLRPGGVAIWVVKAFVRNKQIVPFPDQWRQLCEACGFQFLHEHRAWVVEERGAQHTIFGDVEEYKVERKSFFRRLAEKNGSPRVDWETVLCLRK